MYAIICLICGLVLTNLAEKSQNDEIEKIVLCILSVVCFTGFWYYLGI